MYYVLEIKQDNEWVEACSGEFASYFEAREECQPILADLGLSDDDVRIRRTDEPSTDVLKCDCGHPLSHINGFPEFLYCKGCEKCWNATEVRNDDD